MRCGTTVQALEIERGRPNGVLTNRGRLTASHVVNAAGPSAGAIAASAGLRLPLVARALHVMVLSPGRPVGQSLPWAFDLDREFHYRGDTDDAILAGGFLKDRPVVDPQLPFDPRPPEDWERRVLDSVGSTFCVIDPDVARIDRRITGLFSGPPDGLPIIELSLPGLVTVTGFSGAGVMQAPAAGLLVSELIDGRRCPIDGHRRASGGSLFRFATICVERSVLIGQRAISAL